MRTEHFRYKPIFIFLISTVLVFMSVQGVHAVSGNTTCTPEGIASTGVHLSPEGIEELCGKKAALFHAAGIKLIKSGHNQQALKLIKRACLLEPSNSIYTEDYIVLLSWLGQHEKALSLYLKKRGRLSRRAYLLRNVALSAFSTGRFRLAASLYSRVLANDPADTEAFKGLYNSLMASGDFERVHELLRDFADERRGAGTKGLDLDFLLFKLFLHEKRPLDAFVTWQGASEGDCPCYFQEWKSFVSMLDEQQIQELDRGLVKKNAPIFHRFLLYALSNQYERALRLVEETSDNVWSGWPVYCLSELGWVLFKEDRIERAIKVYRVLLRREPHNKAGILGLVYCLSTKKSFKEAGYFADMLKERYPDDPEALYALAYFHEKQGQFLDAIQVYDKLLRMDPGNETAAYLRVRAFSDMGTPSFAKKIAEGLGLAQPKMTEIELDEAALFQRWGLSKEAESIYLQILEDNPSNERARLDHLLNLRQANRYPEVMEICTDLLEREKDRLPVWAKSPCADAYLYYDMPEKSLVLYEEILKARPGDFNAALGRFYSLVALRQWDEAERLALELFQKAPDGRMIGKKFYPNWSKVAAAIALGYLKSETRPLKEAEEYFSDLKAKAPAHSGISAGLGDVYMWRGWTRRALQELTIAANKDSRDKEARISRAYALNDLGREEEARLLNSRISEKYPFNKHAINQKRLFAAEDMRQFVLDFSNGNEDADSTSFNLRSEINEKPWSTWRLYQYFLWQYSSFNKRSGSFERLGAGFRHRFNASWYWEQEVSAGISGESNLGIGTTIRWTPDDFWTLSAYYNTYSTQTPIRARAAGIDSNQASVTLLYRFSEWRSIKVNMDFMDFSDNNQRLSSSVSLKQGLFRTGDWLSMIYLDNYMSFNSKDPYRVDYWNPRADWSLSLTHLLQYTQWRAFENSTVHRLFVTGGSYYQRNYGTDFTGGFRYELDRQMSLRTNFLLGAGVHRRIYDGDVTTALDFSVHFAWRF